jgi:hypothetical protein
MDQTFFTRVTPLKVFFHQISLCTQSSISSTTQLRASPHSIPFQLTHMGPSGQSMRISDHYLFNVITTIKRWRFQAFKNTILNRIWKFLLGLWYGNFGKKEIAGSSRRNFRLKIKSGECTKETIRIHPWTSEDLDCDSHENDILLS